VLCWLLYLQYEVQSCRWHVVLHVWQRVCPCWWLHSQMLVGLQEFLRSPSLQALPCKATTSEDAQHHLAHIAWQVTWNGATAICWVLLSVLAADKAAHAAVLRDGNGKQRPSKSGGATAA
jgi:hypothetical protein